MDSSGFHRLVKNFTNLTEEENAEAEKLRKQYPYSQLIQVMRARAARDLATPDKDQLLNLTAVYSTDRGVLKQMMTTPRKSRVQEAEVAVAEKVEAPPPPKSKDAPVKQQPAQQPVQVKSESTTLTGQALRDDIYMELEKLQRLKHAFQVSVEEYEKGVSVKPPSREEEISSEPLISEIKSTRKKFKVESPKQQEQNEIIDQFIKSKPVIPKANPVEPAEDLSEDSSALSDNVVSETLVKLLIKQGKKDKAIEVLKKLIWKFPQKKAYFAAQIESLKD